MQQTKIAIIGLGTVGSGVARILCEHADRITSRAGQPVVLTRATVRDLTKTRDIQLPDGMLSDNIDDVVNDPDIEVVVQLVGGIEPARSIMLRLLESGKDVVTANKALLAEHGPELFERARELNRSIAFEAAVAGGIPIITNISQCLSANQITSLRGILNGTSNFIVSRMEEEGAEYLDAVEEAKRLGFAEADPTMDVDGTDAAQKLAILAHLAFGADVDWKDIPRCGIDNLQRDDLTYAGELGYHIKLLAIAQLNGGGLELHVSPTLVKAGRPLAEVRGAYNAISVVGDAVGRAFFHGLGAGQMPTASAVVADVIDMVTGRTQITFRTLQFWSRDQSSVALCDHTQVSGRYYLRLSVDDCPGVLGQITSVLGGNGVSIASVIQHESSEQNGQNVVPLVIMTHSVPDGAVSKALAEIDQLEPVREESVKMRVLD